MKSHRLQWSDWCFRETDPVTPCQASRFASAFVPFFLAIAVGNAAQEARQEAALTAPVNDLPAELQLLLDMDSKQDHRWTLVGKNEKAREQEGLHAELNVVQNLWHFPAARDRSVFKVEFTRPVRKGGNVFHIYIKADGNEQTGRKYEGIHNGVDAMFTLNSGDPNDASSRLDIFDADGKSRRGTCNILVREATLYLAADMTLQQQNGASVFDYNIASYVRNSRASIGLGYCHAVSSPAPESSNARLLVNPGMVFINGQVPGWQIAGGHPGEATLTTSKNDGSLILENAYSPEGLLQTVSLAPGHYLLRALAKTNVFQIHLVAESTRLPIADSDEYQWVELLFCIPHSGDDAPKATQVGFRYLSRPATGNASRLPARLAVKRVELSRLGDTVLNAQWAETLPVDRLHRLKAINESPAWSRPGKVVFQDSFLGTELWLMTQEGHVDHTYVGHPNFSHEGKYLHIGFRRTPRGLLRTNGSARYLNDAWTGIPWPFPWEQKRLPAGVDPMDWIVTARSPAGIQLQNIVTQANHRIELPSRPGWKIIHFPGISTYGGRGPNLRAITHETLVWLSDDKRTIGRSNAGGELFTTFPLRSISSRPEEDQVSTDMSSVGGKAGDNWRDAVDRAGNRYFLFEINRDHLPDHPTNPYQVWALSLTEADKRGLLRAVSHPAATIKEFVTSQTGMTPQPSANWWNLTAGFPWDGDNGMLQLEDGTQVHMSSLGMHSSFAGGSTVSVNDAGANRTRYVGTYPKFDRVSWPHEFRRDRDFAVVASHAEPASPLVMIDLEHTTMWTLALTNFHDYALRYKTRWDPKAYPKPMFRPAPGFSPDFTKVIFFSSMLTGDQPDRLWGDVYVAVARYPEPPANLRKEGLALVWNKPGRHAEIEGFRLYHTTESGRNYERLSGALLTGTRYELPQGASGSYVITSVEYSGLESRTFSNEARVGDDRLFRHFYRPAAGKIAKPMVPFFEPARTGDGYAVAITDPDLINKQALKEGKASGTVTMPLVIPETGSMRILARVRGMSNLERASYTTGWPVTDEIARGRFAIQIGGKKAGSIPVEGGAWHWVEIDAGAVSLATGAVELKIATSDAGIAMENLLVTNDPSFVPRGRGQVPEELSAVPQGLRTGKLTPEDERAFPASSKNPPQARVKLIWDPVTTPQGVSHYNVYRSEKEAFQAEPETLLGSPRECVFYDISPAAGRAFYYRIRAVDAWGNCSPPSAVLSAMEELQATTTE